MKLSTVAVTSWHCDALVQSHTLRLDCAGPCPSPYPISGAACGFNAELCPEPIRSSTVCARTHKASWPWHVYKGWIGRWSAKVEKQLENFWKDFWRPLQGAGGGLSYSCGWPSRAPTPLLAVCGAAPEGEVAQQVALLGLILASISCSENFIFEQSQCWTLAIFPYGKHTIKCARGKDGGQGVHMYRARQK